MTELLIGLGLEPAIFGPWVSSLGWALVHFLWQGSLIGAFFAAGCWLMREGRPQSRYWLGLTSMAAMLVAPVVTFLMIFESSTAALTPATTLTTWADPAIKVVTATFTPDSIAVSLERLLPWIVGTWALGVVVMSTRVGVNWIRLLRLSRVGTEAISPELMQRVVAMQQAMGVQRAVRVVETTVAQVPTVLGWLRPVILLPTSSLVGLTPGQLDLVIAHELGHIRRLDYLVNLFQVLVETLLFYHPAVRWVSRRIRDEREQCCDDLVVATCGNRVQYARALASLETMRGPEPTPAMAATGGQLVQRIERIVCTHRQRESVPSNSGLVLVVIGLVVLAAQLADPMGVFEERRARLADALMADLLAEQSLSNEPYVPLDDARLVPRIDQPTPVSQTPVLAAAAESQPATDSSLPQLSGPAAAPAQPLTEPADRSVAAAITVANSPASKSASKPATSPVNERAIEPAAALPSSAAAPLAAAAEPADNVWTPPVSFDNQLSMPAPADGPQNLDVARISTQDIQAPPQPQSQAPAPSLSLRVPQGPVAIRQISPDYPVKARIIGQEGYALVAFSVASDGRVQDVRVVDSWPRRVFDRPARRAMKGWRFDPNTVKAGERLSQRFDFSLAGTAKPEIRSDACTPLTGTRICRHNSPTAVLAEAANSP